MTMVDRKQPRTPPRPFAVDPPPPRRFNPAMSDAKAKGPTSYFPSIEKKYGKPIAGCRARISACHSAMGFPYFFSIEGK